MTNTPTLEQFKIAKAEKQDNALAKEIAKAMDVPGLRYLSGSPGYAPNAHKMRLEKNTSEAVIAHEMGHARHGKKTDPYVQGALRDVSIPALAAAAGYSIFSKKPSMLPGGINAALNVPTLIEEAIASLHATKYLIKKYGLGTGLKKSLSLFPGYASYATVALAPLAIAALKQGEEEKVAKLTTKLKPHQQRVVDRMEDEDQPGLVAVHGLGSGKTLTSIAVADALGLPADVVTPAALQGNYRKELKAHTRGPPETNIQSLEGVARNGGSSLKNPLLIVDEAHRTRNPGKTREGLMSSAAGKRLALTGSLLYNHPSDVAGPINLVAGRSVLPEDPEMFSQRFLQDIPNKQNLWEKFRGAPVSYQTRLNPRTSGFLQHALDKYVDFHPGSAENFPTREDSTVHVPMTSAQMKLYESVTGEQPDWVRRKVLMNLPPTKAEATQLNSFLSGVRQISNTTRGFDTSVTPPSQPKIDRAVQELQDMLAKNPKAKAIVYSHYLESGIDPYKKKLEELGIPHGSFTGNMPRGKREQMVQDYNDNKLKALLLSSAGGEGLDLKGTRLIQLLEPHWNQEKLKQVIGRGIRYKSHSELPEEERKVLVQRYLATRAPQGLMERIGLKKPGYGVDEYLDNMGVRKEQLNQQVRQMLRQPEND